jgi:hypothetical protein
MSSPELPSFITPHDGGQAPVEEHELVAVAHNLRVTVTDLYAQYIDYVRTITVGEYMLELQLPDATGADKDYWYVAVENYCEGEPDPDALPYEIVCQSISLLRFQDDVPRNGLSYSLTPEHIVRRWDEGDAAGRDMKYKGPPAAESSAETDDDNATAARQTNWEDQSRYYDEFVVPNRRLEVQLGLNGQPPGLDEFNRIVAMITASGAVPLAQKPDESE